MAVALMTLIGNLGSIGIVLICMGAFLAAFALLIAYTALTRWNPNNSLLLGYKYGNWEVQIIHIRKLRTTYWVNFILPVFWSVNYQVVVQYNFNRDDTINVRRKDLEVITDYLNTKYPGRVFVN
jgi:hypothetical protein